MPNKINADGVILIQKYGEAMWDHDEERALGVGLDRRRMDGARTGDREQAGGADALNELPALHLHV